MGDQDDFFEAALCESRGYVDADTRSRAEDNERAMMLGGHKGRKDGIFILFGRWAGFVCTL